MVFVPTALFYWLWGVNAYTTSLWPLCCSLGTLMVVYFTFRREHPVAANWAMVFFGFYYFQLNTVTYLYPDNILLFLTLCCLIVLYQARKQLASSTKEVLYGICFVILNLMAFLTKETIVYALPFYLIIFLYQLNRGENRRFWVTSVLTGTLLLSIYFLMYEVFAGNAFQRFQDIETAGRYVTGEEYFAKRSSVLLSRLTYKPFLFFAGSGLAVPIGFAVAATILGGRNSSFALNNSLGFWSIASLSMLFCIWFGSVSLHYYKPMYLQPRMFHPMLPAFCIVAGLAVEQIWTQRRLYLILALLFLLCAYVAGGSMWAIYLPLTFFFLIFFIAKKPIPFFLGLTAVAIATSIRPIYFIFKPTVFYYTDQKAIIDKHLRHPSGNYVVLTDSAMLVKYDFFYGYQTPKNYDYQRYSAFDATKITHADSVFLLINNGVLEHPDMGIRTRERDILPLFPAAELIDQKGKVKLFYLPKDTLR